MQHQCVQVRHNTEGIVSDYFPQPYALTFLHWSMEGSATIQPPSPDCREPWLHTAVMRDILVEALGPVSLTEHGVDHPSLVHVCDSHSTLDDCDNDCFLCSDLFRPLLNQWTSSLQ